MGEPAESPPDLEVQEVPGGGKGGPEGDREVLSSAEPATGGEQLAVGSKVGPQAEAGSALELPVIVLAPERPVEGVEAPPPPTQPLAAWIAELLE